VYNLKIATSRRFKLFLWRDIAVSRGKMAIKTAQSIGCKYRDCCKSIYRFKVSVAEPIGGKRAVTVPALLRHSLQTYTRMPIKTSQPPSYTSYYVEKRKTKRVFFKQIAQLIHWEPVTSVLEKYYPTGQYNLSDYGIEEQVNDTLSFMCFCGLQLEDDVPDHSVVCRFRKALNHSGA
jgi:Transposase domain (DUF772)